MRAKKTARRRVLEDHHRRGKVYVPPFLAGLGDYPNLRGHTWLDDVSPELMWIALLYLAAPEQSGELAQQVVGAVRSVPGIQRPASFVVTSSWMGLPPETCRHIRTHLRRAGCFAEVADALAPLVWFYPDCPMAPVFRRRSPKPTPERLEAYLETIHRAARLLLIRRTRDAALIQGVAVYAAVAGGGMSPNGLDLQHLPRLMEYPDTPESRRMERRVRMTSSMLARTCDQGPQWREYFWRRGYSLSPCLLARDRFQAGAEDSSGAAEAVVELFEQLSTNLEKEFKEGWTHWPIDLAHPQQSEVLGGLLARQVRYLRHLLITPRLMLDELGQPLLRSMVESAITLAWLIRKGQPDDYTRFVLYGLGQEKLALEHLKAAPPESSPYLENRRQQELYVRGDCLEGQRVSWLTQVDVSAGWMRGGPRELAEQAGMIDLYNRVYGPTSAQVHGSWNAVACTAMRYCLNPLHRLHLVPDVETTRVDLSMLVTALRILERSWEATREWATELPPSKCLPAALSQFAVLLGGCSSGNAGESGKRSE